MPRLSVWFIRAALVYLALGVTFGGLILAHKGIPLNSVLWQLLPIHIAFLLFGWMVQLVMVVAFWIFPRFFRSRGNEKPAWLAFWLLNGGVLLAGVSPILSLPVGLLLAGRLAETGAVIAFAVHVWPRIKPPGVSKMLE